MPGDASTAPREAAAVGGAHHGKRPVAAATATARLLDSSRPAALARRVMSSALRGFFLLRTRAAETCFLSSSEQGARLSRRALRLTALAVMSTKEPGSKAARRTLARWRKGADPPVARRPRRPRRGGVPDGAAGGSTGSAAGCQGKARTGGRWAPGGGQWAADEWMMMGMRGIGGSGKHRGDP